METSKQETETLSNNKWKWVEASIWSENMLTALDNGVKGGKWFSLIDKVYKKKTLEMAWKKVRSNRGASGVDDITIAKFKAKEEEYLTELYNELKEGTYQPEAVQRIYIPKGQGKKRPLGIPTVKDRIAQQAVKMVLEPIFENEFVETSYGFRPNRGAKQAIAQVEQLIKEGYIWAVDADLQAYFDTIPHDKLQTKVQEKISDGRINSLIKMWLTQEVMEECKNWTPTQGTPQGGVISPLLANIYLHGLDIEMSRAGYKMVRYADDFVILTQSESQAQQALEIVQNWVEGNGLTLHPEKTHLGNCMIKGEGFDFLGYRFEGGDTWVRNKSSQAFRERVRQKTSRCCGKSIQKVIDELNPILRGWCQYFKEVTKYTLVTFDGFVRRRLRAIIAQQNKKRCFGAGRYNQKIPNKFFAKLGLFDMENYQVLARAGRSR